METELANLLAEVEQRYPVKVNEYCRKLAERSAAVSRLYLPDPRELEDLGLSSDGLAEREQSPVPKLIRRYTDRAVVLTTTECFVRCRFCFRNRLRSGIRTRERGRAVPARSAEYHMERRCSQRVE